MRTAVSASLALTLSLCLTGGSPPVHSQPQSGKAITELPECGQNQTGLRLPRNFCATIFADNIGHARHMTVSPSGVLYVNTWSGRYFVGQPKAPPGGFLVALQDTKHTGHADVVRRFGDSEQTGGHGGTGIEYWKGGLYYEVNDRIERYALPGDAIVPEGQPEVVVSGLPLGGDHPMHPFAIDAKGNLYVDVASATNSCQRENRMLQSPGLLPCTELETRGGIWRFDASARDQKFTPEQRFATGIRNADGIAIDASGTGLYATQHGRDQLGQNWPKLYTVAQGAILPAEELVRVVQGGDYGWPACYFDAMQDALVLAPEYGGNGGRERGVCAQKLPPVAAFQAHWAPDDLLIYTGTQFPESYRNGAFIAFHGSWNRAPFAQGGYNVAFQPLANGRASGPCAVFADGFAGAHRDPGGATHRPAGLAQGTDGSLYVADDVRGRIYRISYVGVASAKPKSLGIEPCPAPDTPAGPVQTAGATPPEGTQPNAGAADEVSHLPVPPGASRSMLALGASVYHGQVAGATCTGCHGPSGEGTPLGPDLRSGQWLWGDGSPEAIRKSIADGVAQPKRYRSPMPPMGGTQLSTRQLQAVADYVWAISHRQQ